MGCLSWLIFGGLAGWVASLLTGRNRGMGCLGNVLVGIVGAFLGGLAWQLITGDVMAVDWTWEAFAVAVAGSVILLLITGWFRRGR